MLSVNSPHVKYQINKYMYMYFSECLSVSAFLSIKQSISLRYLQLFNQALMAFIVLMKWIILCTI